MAAPFLGLAYAELKVNFVEGFAVQCLRRLSLRCFNGLRPFLGFNGYAVSVADAVSMALSVSCPVRDNASVG